MSARLTRTHAGFTLTLNSARTNLDSAPDTRSARTLSDPHCDQVAQAAVLMIALALEDRAQVSEPTDAPREGDGNVGTRPNTASISGDPAQHDADTKTQAATTSAPLAPAHAATATTSADEAPAAPPRSRRATRSSSIALRGAALLDAGFLPHAAVGPELGVALVPSDRLRVELAGFWLPWRTSAPGDGGRVAVTLWALRPMGCLGLWRSSPLEVDGCVGFELGRARARGSDLSVRREPDWLYRAGWAALRLGARLADRWALLLEPGVAIPLGRPRYVSEATGSGAPSVLHTASPVAFRSTLALVRRF